ncbi:uncharacterized protein LOC135503234 isoform X2 [Lineus longissimus]
MSRRHDAVAMATYENTMATNGNVMATSRNAKTDNIWPSSREEILINSRNLMRNSLAAWRKSRSKKKRSAALLGRNDTPSDKATEMPATGLSDNSSVTPSNSKKVHSTADNKTNSTLGLMINTSKDSTIDPNDTRPVLTSPILPPTSSIPFDFLNDTLLLDQNDEYVDDNDTLSSNQSGVYGNSVPRFVESETFIISLIVGICLLITLVSVTIFLCYRRNQGCQRPNLPASKRLSTLSNHSSHGSCNGTNPDDAVTLSYINAQFDQKFLQDNPEEMQSLENDTFLNSLESMMFVNRWTDTASTSKL